MKKERVEELLRNGVYTAEQISAFTGFDKREVYKILWKIKQKHKDAFVVINDEVNLYTLIPEIEVPDVVYPKYRIRKKRKAVYEIVKIPYDEVYLVPFGDLHFGAKSCRVDLAKQVLDWIKENDNVAVILMGDLTDNVTKNSVGDIFEQRLTPEEQINGVIKLLRPIADKCIANIEGNHSRRTWKEAGISPDAFISAMLNIPFFPEFAVIDLALNGYSVRVFATHGSTSATTDAGKLRAMQKTRDILLDADIVLYGHIHSMIKHNDVIYRIRNGDLVRVHRLYVSTGGFLDYIGSYATIKNYKPTPLGTPIIHISPEGITVDDNTFRW